MNALEIKNLTKHYKDFTLDNISLTLPGGCILGLIGENGAGKTTAVKLMTGMIKKDGGLISVLGRDENSIIKEDIGIVTDDIGISGCLSALKLEKILKRIYKNWDSGIFHSLLAKLSVPDNKIFSELSLGTKKKLAIAAALSHNAKLLIFDEATSGLDPIVRDEVTDILSDFTRSEEHSVLISSHIVSDLEKICDYIAFIHKGRLLLFEEKDRLYEKYAVIRCGADELSLIDSSSVIGKRVNNYGAEAIILKDKAPIGLDLSPIDIEKLFIFMVKEND